MVYKKRLKFWNILKVIHLALKARSENMTSSFLSDKPTLEILFHDSFQILGGRGNALDRVKSFAEKERSTFFIKTRKGKVQVQGHQFQPAQYTHSTFCGYCDRLLWGIGPQGYQCSGKEELVIERTIPSPF